MKLIIAGLFFASVLILSPLADANQSVAEAESVTLVGHSETAISTDVVTLDGIVYIYGPQVPEGVRMWPGSEYRLGMKCVKETLSTFTLKQKCSWEKVVKATDVGLVVLPGGTSSTETVPNADKIFVSLVLLFSLCVLIPYKPIGFATAVLIMVFSLVMALGTVLVKSLFWAGLLALTAIAAFAATVSIVEKVAYLWRMPVIALTVTIWCLVP